jgi:peptidyl-tRNA hydrolase
VSVSVGSATVRVLLPHPVADTPLVLSRLQVSGLELSDPDLLAADGVAGSGGPVLGIELSPHAVMSTGKACAQVGHAAQLGLMFLPDQGRVRAWAAAGFPLRVRTPSPQVWQELLAADAEEVVVVRDAGFTEVDPGTVTAAAHWRVAQPVG